MYTRGSTPLVLISRTSLWMITVSSRTVLQPLGGGLQTLL
ncbi:hypothetical protein COPCOM_02304 [Coprococcus comes ATCC 27758]|uniref:Uncharacterized protein n=1 Tax=Coprococcus comes ATCC 27758 TaxID=470146 RepID=C0BB48_9FIRM|nr:hypothetical protein COPCOM_02304 [Coprococcus comes ATCC 27758]